MTGAAHMPDQAPHARPDLERQILGQMIGTRTGWDLYAAAGVRETDFFRRAHRLVFHAIAAIAAAGVPPDLLTVGEELRGRGHLEEVGVVYFSGLVDGIVGPTAEGATFIAHELAALTATRAVQHALQTGDLAAVAREVDAAQMRAAGDQRVYDAAAQLAAVRADAARDAAARVWLGIPSLDNILGGVRPGEVLGLMARPGIGKTLVLGHIAQRVAETELGQVFFSLEMPAPQIVERLACAHYGLPRHAVRERLQDGALDEASYRSAFGRFVLIDVAGLSVSLMAAKLRQIQVSLLRDAPIRLVTVDHLGLIGGDRAMNTYDRISTQVRELKELAKRFEVSVLLAVQVNRESGGDGSKELHLGSARDSGVVEETMDYLIALRRLDRSQALRPFERERYRDVLFAKVIKHRHGATDDEIAVRFDPRTLRLTEDPNLQAEEDDLARIAATAGGRRR